MQTQKEQIKPTLESFNLSCRIFPAGVKAMNDDGNPMCAWVVTFTNTTTNRSESFDYFTGYGCGPLPTDKWLNEMKNIRPGTKDRLIDKTIMPRIAHEWAEKMKWAPDPIEILWAIARDGDANQESFDDWAANFGYDADSRKAEKIYNACRENFFKLRKIMLQDNIEKIASIEI